MTPRSVNQSETNHADRAFSIDGPVSEDTLVGLAPGQTALVDEISARPTMAKRLADMGFVHGTQIEMIRRGAPCIVRVGGTCVGLGIAHQASVLLCPTMPSD